MKTEVKPAEELHARFLWYVLNKIKAAQLLLEAKQQSISYALFLYPQNKAWNIPNANTEQFLLNNLIELGVIEETNENAPFQIGKEYEHENPTSAGVYYYLKINNVAFDKYYEKQQKLINKYDKADAKGNLLTFHENGEIEYIDSDGNEYHTKLNKTLNQFKLLKFLVYNPRQVFKFDELAKNLNKVKSGVDYPDDERRVRDTIQSIKDKLMYKGDGLFESSYGFGLSCDVLIKK